MRRSDAGVPVVLGSRSLRRPSAELFEQSDHHGLGSADVAEPIAALVLRQLSDKFDAVGAQTGNDVLDAVDGEAPYPGATLTLKQPV
ncbi:hypothetical protein Raf01_95260 [Rugosimonospora africana]|uniref:Uncharacterized protein n=1 Tax=Rugosimonospora africana TaxID=556532 RepID=A0A8J3VWY2_9ACTN|nr:hypothetical protein Raf01_95260 [Rugosimonospora africana]